MNSRKITVYTVEGSHLEIIDSEATVWRELKADLTQNSINYAGKKPMIEGDEVTLQSEMAALPEGEFTLMLFTEKVKSGASYYNAFRKALTKLKKKGAQIIIPKTTDGMGEMLRDLDAKVYNSIVGKDSAYKPSATPKEKSLKEASLSTAPQASVQAELKETESLKVMSIMTENEKADLFAKLSNSVDNINDVIEVLKSYDLIIDMEAKELARLKESAARMLANLS